RVFLQQPVATEPGARGWQQRFGIVEADGAYRLRPGGVGPRNRPLGGNDQRAEEAAEDQLVQAERRLVGSREIEAQLVERYLVELDALESTQANAQAAAHASRVRQLRERQIGREREILHRCDLERPQRHVVCGAKLA